MRYPLMLLAIKFRGQKHKVEDAVKPTPQESVNFGDQLAGYLRQAANFEPFNIPILLAEHSQECRECQSVNLPASPKAPLRPLPLMQVSFDRIGMDLVRPLDQSAQGHAANG